MPGFGRGQFGVGLFGQGDDYLYVSESVTAGDSVTGINNIYQYLDDEATANDLMGPGGATMPCYASEDVTALDAEIDQQVFPCSAADSARSTDAAAMLGGWIMVSG